MGRTILITGASRGIGRATAILCGRRGWSVAVNYERNAAAAAETVEAVEAAGGRAVAIQADVSDEAAIIGLFDAATEALGVPDGVVNNAGIVTGPQKLADIDLARIKRLFRVNAIGALLVAREAARRLPDGGALVNLSSKAALIGAPNEYVDYAATKGAVDSMTVGLAKELAPRGIRVNAVRPGVTVTEMNTGPHDPGRAERIGRITPMGRPGEPEEIAEAVVWLLSDAASYVTGTFIDVSGGR